MSRLKNIAEGMRAAYRTPRGLIYGTVTVVWKNGRACFRPDAGTTYGEGSMTDLDVTAADLEPGVDNLRPVAL